MIWQSMVRSSHSRDTGAQVIGEDNGTLGCMMTSRMVSAEPSPLPSVEFVDYCDSFELYSSKHIEFYCLNENKFYFNSQQAPDANAEHVYGHVYFIVNNGNLHPRACLNPFTAATMIEELTLLVSVGIVAFQRFAE